MTQPGQTASGLLSRTTFWSLFLGRPRSRQDHLNALDGLRGLAVLIVLGSHLSNTGLLPHPGLSGSGKSGVYLFFTLSAFLLTRALLRRPLADFANAWRWANYALRRVLRIWPLYLVLLLLSWALTRAGVAGWHYQMDTASLLRHLSLREGQSVLWSIPVEFIFYLWLPLLALGLAVMQARRWPLWAEGVVFVSGLGLAYVLWPPATTLPNDVRLGPYLAVFLCGAYAARLDLRLQATSLPSRPRIWALAGLASMLAWLLTIPSVWAGIHGTAFVAGVSSTWFIWYGLVWSVLLLAILHGPDWLCRPFAWPPLRLVGVVSFSLYLWHMPVMDALRGLGVARWPLLAPGMVLAVAVLAVAVLVAMASFLLLERPWREVRLQQAQASPRGASSGPR